jgi:sugar lactone lactonase YvrE
MKQRIEVSALCKIGQGIERPETILVDRAGRVYASDKSSAVAELLSNGGLRRMGSAGGDPNGIAMDSAGRFLIANHGLGKLQRLHPETGRIDLLLEDVADGYPIKWINYVLVDLSGGIWVSVSTATDDPSEAIANGVSDGFILHIEPDGTNARVVADGIGTPNCMALDRQGRYIYVVRTLAADVVRFEIIGKNLKGEEEYSPPPAKPSAEQFRKGLLSQEGLDENIRRAVDLGAAKGSPFADGCAFDADGNLWVTFIFTNSVMAVTPDRELIRVIDDPTGEIMVSPTSIAWGGDDLRNVYIGSTVSRYVVQGRSSVAGMPMIHQR